MKNKRFLPKLLIFIGMWLVIAAGITVFFDPFYHYHKSWEFLKTVLTERDYQVAGTLDNFNYDAVILGTSIAENINTYEVDNLFDCTSVKAIRASGSNSDILYYLDRAYANNDIKVVIYALSVEEFVSDTELTYKKMDYYYLLDKNPLNDIEYILNKDVLLEKIPMQLGYSYLFDYEEGESYSWYKTKTFSSEAVTGRYYPYNHFDEEKDCTEDIEKAKENIQLLKKRITAHPETVFYLYTSPYSALWWDNAYRMGESEKSYAVIKLLNDELACLDNVRFYNFVYDTDYTFNLDLYMDTVHFSQNINSEIIRRMKEEPTNEELYSKSEDTMREEVKLFSEVKIKEIYPDCVVK